jgi:hypothetical protein
LPYYLDAFDLLGRLGSPRLPQPQRHEGELPLQDWIVRFGER